MGRNKIHSAIQDAIREENLIVFVGSGYSTGEPLNLPNWRKLIEIFASKLHEKYNEEYLKVLPLALSTGLIDEIMALDTLYKNNHQYECFELLRHEIDVDMSQFNLNKFAKLWQISDRIITTNYDMSIEKSIDGVLKISYNDRLDVANLDRKKQYLFKIHGCISKPNECIMFRNSYEKLYKNDRLFTTELSSLFAHKTVLFVGFSLKDPYLTYILKEMAVVYEGNKGKHFVITTSNEDFSEFDVETIKLKDYNELNIYLDSIIDYKSHVDYSFEAVLKKVRKHNKEVEESKVKEKYYLFIEDLTNNPDQSNAFENILKGDLEAAEMQLKTSLDLNLHKKDAFSLKAANDAYTLGRLKLVEFNFNEAIKYLTIANELDKNNPTYLDNLGELYLTMENLNKSKEYFDLSLSIKLNRFGENHPEVAISYNNLGLVQGELGNPESGIDLLKKAIKINEGCYGESHHTLVVNYNSIGVLFYKGNNFERSLKYRYKALKIGEKIFGEIHQVVSTIHNNLGVTWDKYGRYDKAIYHSKKALYIDQKLYGDVHPLLANLYNNIGLILSKVGSLNESVEYHKSAQEIFIHYFGSRHPKVSKSYHNLGLTYHELAVIQKDESDKWRYFKLGIDNFKAALTVDLDHYGFEDFKVAYRHKNLAIAFEKFGKYQQAAYHYNLGKVIAEKALGENNNFTKDIALDQKRILYIIENMN